MCKVSAELNIRMIEYYAAFTYFFFVQFVWAGNTGGRLQYGRGSQAAADQLRAPAAESAIAASRDTQGPDGVPHGRRSCHQLARAVLHGRSRRGERRLAGAAARRTAAWSQTGAPAVRRRHRRHVAGVSAAGSVPQRIVQLGPPASGTAASYRLLVRQFFVANLTGLFYASGVGLTAGSISPETDMDCVSS